MPETDRLEALIEPVVEHLGYELWGIEYRAGAGEGLLRVFIDSPDGITLDDCTLISEHLSGLLDVEEPIRGAYTLEVSSPGLDRQLFRPAHYERFAGALVKLRLLRAHGGRRNFKGRLLGLTGEQVALEIDGQTYEVPLSEVESARLIPEL
ncbi:MAG: ribosome maturation factor RimP [Gammaproteobacteria bacterium]